MRLSFQYFVSMYATHAYRKHEWCEELVRRLPDMLTREDFHNTSQKEAVELFRELIDMGLDCEIATPDTWELARMIQRQTTNTHVYHVEGVVWCIRKGSVWNLQTGKGFFISDQNHYERFIAEYYTQNNKRAVEGWWSGFDNDNRYHSEPYFPGDKSADF